MGSTGERWHKFLYTQIAQKYFPSFKRFTLFQSNFCCNPFLGDFYYSRISGFHQFDILGRADGYFCLVRIYGWWILAVVDDAKKRVDF